MTDKPAVEQKPVEALPESAPKEPAVTPLSIPSGPIRYQAIPRHDKDNGGGAPAVNPLWRVELQDLAGVEPPLGLDVSAESIIGRGVTADVDLSDRKGAIETVSRRHALLRPAAQHIYLLDLGSTNGTRINSHRLISGVEHPLHTGDVIGICAMSFTYKFVARIAISEPPNVPTGSQPNP